MTERITSTPEQGSVTCVQLPGQEIGLARGEMAKTSGGCILPGEDPLEHLEDIMDYIDDALDYIDDAMSEWWNFWY